MIEFPSNYGAQWKKEFFFENSEFVPGSPQNWIDPNRLYMDIPHELSAAEIKNVTKITDALAHNECGKGVLFALCQREDFSFSDVYGYLHPIDSEGKSVLRKKGGHTNCDALLSHLVAHAWNAKLIELRKAEEDKPRSTFEVGSSSRSQRSVPGFTPFQPAFDFPGLYAAPEVRARATQLLKAKGGDWFRNQLEQIMTVVSDVLLKHFCIYVSFY